MTTKEKRIVQEELAAARDRMTVGKDTRNAYNDGALDAIERLARRLGVASPPSSPDPRGDLP